MRLTQRVCNIHHCPILEFPDSTLACWFEHAQHLIGHEIVDIGFDEGVVVWIFENYETIPLIGVRENKPGVSSFEIGDIHLDLMARAILREATWDREKGQGKLLVGEEGLEGTGYEGKEYWWGVTLSRQR